MTEPATPPSGGSTPVVPPIVPTPAPATPPAPPPAPAAVVAPPASPPAPNPARVEMSSEQLTERLRAAEQAATKKLLKEQGFEKPEDLAAALKRLKEADDANLTEQQRLKAQVDELSPKAQRLAATETLFTQLVEEQFAALPDAVKQAIDAEAKGSAESRLTLMRVLRASGALTAPPPVPAPPPGPPPVAPPASITPSPAPAPSGTPTKFQEWEAMKARAPLLGDIFYQQNQREIERTRPAA